MKKKRRCCKTLAGHHPHLPTCRHYTPQIISLPPGPSVLDNMPYHGGVRGFVFGSMAGMDSLAFIAPMLAMRSRMRRGVRGVSSLALGIDHPEEKHEDQPQPPKETTNEEVHPSFG